MDRKVFCSSEDTRDIRSKKTVGVHWTQQVKSRLGGAIVRTRRTLDLNLKEPKIGKGIWLDHELYCDSARLAADCGYCVIILTKTISITANKLMKGY